MTFRKGWALTQVPYLVRFGLSLVRRRPLPLVGGFSLTDVCNLACGHCWRANQGRGHLPWPGVVNTLQTLFDKGARYLYLQGGEPYCWKHEDRRLADVVDQARRIGFFHIAVCTNGTHPLIGDPDSFSVSLDGRPEHHDAIRCKTFERVLGNIGRTTHPNVFVNVTFNKLNARDLSFMAELVRSTRGLRGLLVNFHIPYAGVENLALSPQERFSIASEALQLKRAGYPILNTRSGLLALANNDWKRPLDLSLVTDGVDYYSCCRARGQKSICEQCGYGIWAELSMLYRLDLGSIVESYGKLHFG